MTRRDSLYPFLFYMVVGTLYAFALSSSIVTSTVLEIPAPLVLFLCALSLLVYFFIFYNRYTFLGTLSVLAVVGLILWFTLLWTEFQAEWYLNLRDYLEELVEFAEDIRPYRSRYNTPFALAITAMVGFMTALNMKVHFNFYLLTLLGVAVMSVPLIMDFVSSNATMVLFLFCFLILLARKLNLIAIGREAKERQTLNLGFSLTLLPIGLLVVGIAWIIPKPDIGFLDSRSSSEPVAGELVYSADAPRRVTVFNENGGRLGGQVEVSREHVMEVEAEERVYLGGLVRDIYTGDSWTLSTQTREVLEATEGIYYYASDYSSPLYDEAMEPEIQAVTIYNGQGSSTIFAPPFKMMLELPDETYTVYKSNYGELRLDRPMVSGSSYSLYYLSWDYDGEELADYLRQVGSSENSEAASPFLQLPGMPQRVYDLAEELTADCDNDYDRMKALEAYLVTFRYTLQPPSLPPGEDFVDHFLFESQEGYCTYYASAMAVMGRCLGIPTRYVEGYALPSKRNVNGRYYVTNAQAHAWVEVYFPQFGWMPFEATAPYFYNFYGEQAPRPTEVFSEELVNDETYMDDLGFEQELQPEPVPQPEVSVNPPEGGTTTIPSPIRDWEPPEIHPRQLLIAVAVGIVSLIVLVILINRLRLLLKLRRLSRIERLPGQEASVQYFGQILKSAKACGYPIHGYETAYSYARRVEHRFPFREGETTMEDLADIFYRASYGRKDIGDGEKLRLKACCREMLTRLRRDPRRKRGQRQKSKDPSQEGMAHED